MQSWRKLFVVGLIKGFYEQTMLSLHKKKRICEHESSINDVTAAALKKRNPSIIILQIPSERSEREKKTNNNNILCLFFKK